MINKKISSIFILFGITLIILWGCTKVERDNPLDPSGTAYVAPATKVVVLADDFQSYPTGPGDPPYPWVNFKVGSVVCEIQNEPAPHYKIAWFTVAAGNQFDSYLMARSINLTGEFFVEFSIAGTIYATGKFKTCFQLLDASGHSSYCEIGMSDNNNAGNMYFYANNGSGALFGNQIDPAANTWYRIKVQFNLKHKKFTAWYNNIVFVDNQDLPNVPDSISMVGFQGQLLSTMGTTQTVGIDDFEIYKMQ